MHEDEILKLLSASAGLLTELGKFHRLPEPTLPSAVWSRLYFDIAPYLAVKSIEGDETLTFYHSQFTVAAADKFLANGARTARHREIAHFFASQPLYYGPAVPNRRKLYELGFQLAAGDDEATLAETITSFDFLEAKCIAGMGYDLLNDCDLMVMDERLPHVAAVREAVAAALPAIVVRPERALQSLYNRLNWTGLGRELLEEELDTCRQKLDLRGSWLCLDGPMPTLPSGAISFPIAISSRIQSANDEVLAVGAITGEIAIYRLRTGMLVRQQTGPARNVIGISVAPLGDSLACVDLDGYVWSERGTTPLRGRRGECTILDTGSLIIAVRQDGALVGWNPENNDCVVLTTSIPQPISVVRRCPETGAVVIVAGYDRQRIGIANLKGVAPIYREVPFHGPRVYDADLNGGLLLTSAIDRRVRIINADTGKEVASLAYEATGDYLLEGAAEHCAFGRGDMKDAAVFCTTSGQVAWWFWKSGSVEAVTGPAMQSIVVVRTIALGKILVSTTEGVTVLARAGSDQRRPAHDRAVDYIDITANRTLVSLSVGGKSLAWHSGVPLKCLSKRVLRDPTTMVAQGSGDMVLVGDRAGTVWQVSPSQQSVQEGPPLARFLEPVVSLSVPDDESVIAAAASGSIVHIDRKSQTVSKLRSGTGFLRQHMLLSAGKSGLCWSIHVETRRQDMQTVLSLFRASGRERVVFRGDIVDFDSSPDGNALCLADQNQVRVFHRRHLPWFGRGPAKATPVTQVAFVGGSNLLAVALRFEPRIEVWQVARGFPVAAGIELPDYATCLAANSVLIGVGLRSGDVLSMRLHRA